MSREHAFVNMLDAAAKMQWNVAMMLEAKAVEAEKARNWALNHFHAHSFESHAKQLEQPLGFHEGLVEVIEGLTKMENGLCSNLKTLLASDEGSGEGGMGGMAGMYGGGAGFGEDEK
ncbi:restriction endonuclease subunit S [Paenibacillus sp. CAA11]|uniref:restriction endonuclease subunit S n=1 Tax=Paenibacillus sp. CAA11 TaxID=1532905 RepID=UPI000D345F33|nr:restriction endonuclease subunit S [Paenibacillus sp. CAA11]AWB45814.1 restriction endonuclease subunit S [Paenibacillus sp. CAA11]